MAARGFVHLLPVDAQPDELPPPRARSLPLFPVVHAHTPSHPLVQLRDDSIGLAETKVVHPAYHVSPELPQHAEGRYPSAAAGYFLYAFLEPFECLLRPDDSSPVNLKPQEGTFGQTRGSALLAVDH